VGAAGADVSDVVVQQCLYVGPVQRCLACDFHAPKFMHAIHDPQILV
jgi:hypothetical protein